jgi:myo-inositol-1(or 4)-monophosphatase
MLEAGELAMMYYGKTTRTIKEDATVLTEADTAIEEFLKVALTHLAPDFGYIGEETEQDRPPKNGETRSWVDDALDGSRAFVVQMPIWTPAVAVVDGDKPIAGVAINPLTQELFWADVEGPAFYNDQPMVPNYNANFDRYSFIIAPTNHHRLYKIDFPGRIYCMGSPIYQFCMAAMGSVSGIVFNPKVYIWDLAVPAVLFDRVGGEMRYASGKLVDCAELMDRQVVKETVFAGGPEVVAELRKRVELINTT